MKPKRKIIFYSLLFAVFLLTYMVTLSVTDEYAKELKLTSSFMLHYAPGLTRIAGFISFWLSRRFIANEKVRRIILMIAACLFLISSGILVAGMGTVITLTALFILSFSAGHLGGLVYYCISIAFETSHIKGRMIGASCAASVILQYILTGNSSKATQLIIAAVLFMLISYMLIRTPADYALKDPLPYADDSAQYCSKVRLQLITIASIIPVCSLLACRTDVAFVSMSFDGNINIYSYPRLAMIPGYLLMGFAADLKKQRYFGMAFISSMLISSVLVLMPFFNNGYTFFLSVYYFFISVYVFFYTYSFVSIAPRTKRPELWASLGRPLSDLCVATISFVMLRIGSDRLNSRSVYYALYYFALLMLLYLIVSINNIDPNLSLTDEAPDASTDTPTLDEWLSRFTLTPRETDVVHLLIETDIPVKAIAIELGISERSVYRFAASIYEKTGTDNRAGLLKEFMKLSTHRGSKSVYPSP